MCRRAGRHIETAKILNIFLMEMRQTSSEKIIYLQKQSATRACFSYKTNLLT